MVIKGQKINDRYQIIRTIGEGGMASVYLAEDTILNRKVAVKILRGDLSSDDKFVRRFQREALSASSLSHPNIVEMYDVGEDDGNYYIVMEYVEGKTLKQLIKKRGALALTEVIDIMLQLSAALAHAHESYIIHRDIKPQNILIMEDGRVKITDFGIAMAMNSTQLTQTNSVMGSVHYLPPEQANGNGATIKSDIYSLGILLYELLVGKIPFKGDNVVEVALKQLKDEVPSVRKQNSNIPQSIENVIIKATAKNPQNRYSDATEMYNDIKTVLDESRQNEEKYIYKHEEQDVEATKKISIINGSKFKEPKKESESEIAKPIEDKKINKTLVILSSIIGGLLLIFLTIFLIIPSFSKAPEVKIPDVSGMTVAEAEAALKELGFEVALQTEKIPSDEVEEGKIIKTEPAIGLVRRKGTLITLFESTGSKAITLEDYTDRNYIEVKTILEELYGLNVLVEKTEVNDEDIGENDIVKQSPEAGVNVTKGDTIILYIPDIILEYPDMVEEGWTETDAEAFANKYGIILTKEYVESIIEEPGTIIYQSRPAGGKIIKGTTLRIRVIKKPVIEIPDDDNDEENGD